MNETLIIPVSNSGNSWMITIPSNMTPDMGINFVIDENKNIYCLCQDSNIKKNKYLVSIDKDGKFRWQSTLVTTQFEESVLINTWNVNSLIIDNGYLYVLGLYAYRTTGSKDGDSSILKFDLNGNLINSIRYDDGTGWGLGYGGIVTKDYVVCYTSKWISSASVSRPGIMVFTKNNMTLKSCKYFSNMNIYYTKSFTNINENIFFSFYGNRIIKYNANNATVIFNKAYSNFYSNTNNGQDIQINLTTDGTFIYGLGTENNLWNNSNSILFLKLDTNGNIITCKKLTNFAMYMTYYKPFCYYDGYLYALVSRYDNENNQSTFCLKIDLEGNIKKVLTTNVGRYLDVKSGIMTFGNDKRLFKLDLSDFEDFNLYKYGNVEISTPQIDFNFETITITVTNQTDGALADMTLNRSTAYTCYLAKPWDSIDKLQFS